MAATIRLSLLLVFGALHCAHSEDTHSEAFTGILTGVEQEGEVIKFDFYGTSSNPNIGGLSFYEIQKASDEKRAKLLASKNLVGSRVTIRITAPVKDWWMIRGGILGFPLADAAIEIKSAYIAGRFK